MERSDRYVCRVLLLVVSFIAPSSPAQEPERKPGVPAYDNRDLDRIHGQREEVGFASLPAVIAAGRPPAAPTARKSGEEFWRHEADAHRGRIALLQRALAELQDKAASARRPVSGRGRPGSAAPPPSFERRIAALQGRIRDEEARFLDRARREGALPGWLR